MSKGLLFSRQHSVITAAQGHRVFDKLVGPCVAVKVLWVRGDYTRLHATEWMYK